MIEMWRCLTCVSIAAVRVLFSFLYKVILIVSSSHFLFHSLHVRKIM